MTGGWIFRSWLLQGNGQDRNRTATSLLWRWELCWMPWWHFKAEQWAKTLFGYQRTCLVVYINKLWGTVSRSLCFLAHKNFLWTYTHFINLSARYIHGKQNMMADQSHGVVVLPRVFEEICRVCGRPLVARCVCYLQKWEASHLCIWSPTSFSLERGCIAASMGRPRNICISSFRHQR